MDELKQRLTIQPASTMPTRLSIATTLLASMLQTRMFTTEGGMIDFDVAVDSALSIADLLIDKCVESLLTDQT